MTLGLKFKKVPGNRTTVNIRSEFSDSMQCESDTDATSLDMSSGHGGSSTIAPNSVECLTVDPNDVPPAALPGVSAVSEWYWTATLNNIADGILRITINNPISHADVRTGVSRFQSMTQGEPNKRNLLRVTGGFLLRKGLRTNQMVAI